MQAIIFKSYISNLLMQISKFDSEDEEFPDEDELDKDMKKCETSLSLYKSGIFSNINTLKSKVYNHLIKESDAVWTQTEEKYVHISEVSRLESIIAGYKQDAKRYEEVIGKAKKEKGEKDFLIEKLEVEKAAHDKKLKGLHILLDIYKAGKNSMIDKFTVIEKFMSMVNKNFVMRVSELDYGDPVTNTIEICKNEIDQGRGNFLKHKADSEGKVYTDPYYLLLEFVKKGKILAIALAEDDYVE